MKKRKFWVFSLKGQLSWGKYMGKSHEWVIDNDPEYLVWVIYNLKTHSCRFKKCFEEYWVAKMKYSLFELRLSTGLPCRKQIQ